MLHIRHFTVLRGISAPVSRSSAGIIFKTLWCLGTKAPITSVFFKGTCSDTLVKYFTRTQGEAEVNPWVYDPRRERRLLSLSSMGYSELYAAKRPEPRVFLEVRREPVAAVPWVPMSPDDRASAFSVLPEALGGYLDLFRSIVEISTQAPQLGYPPSAFTGPALNLTRLSQWSLNALYRSIPLNNITLKQFRDASHPDLICYQALVNSQIGVRRYNGAGPLGDTNLLLGDPSGGFRIWVDRCEDQPAVELLGIEVSREMRVGYESVDVLRPLFPFWIDMDLDYSVGNHICWRTKDGSWRRGNVDDAPNHFPLPPAKDPDCSFNTARSGAIQTITGPFDFPNTTLRVLPLLADPDRLDRFVRDHLKNDFFQFEAWGSWVYLVATNYEEMSSATNDIGWWAS